jgi:N-acetylglucosaminyl-diphospho-decaprenol L-rhamnosyltransferase
MTAALSVVIVNWNTRDLLARCLASLLAGLGDLSSEVIVLDNASTDESSTMVRHRHPELRLIESRKNMGFAGGVNAALQQACGDTLLLLNPDTEIVGDVLRRLYTCLADVPAVAAIAPQLQYSDGTPQGSWGAFPSLRQELPWLRNSGPAPRTRTAGEWQLLDVDWAKGACLMIRRAAWEQVGGLDEDYWLYTEEADWCYRARQLGWTIAVLPSAHVVHEEQAASRQNAGFSLIQYQRSRAVFVAKHRSTLAARALWGICAVKAATYVLSPGRSPLGRSRNDFEIEDVRRAYLGLLSESGRRMMAPSVSNRLQA